MPHVVLKGKVSVENIFQELTQLFYREGKTILRTTDIYLEKEKGTILIDSLAIEDEKKTTFLVMISQRDDGIVIRLYPRLDVEKTEGVKRMLAELAKKLMSTFPQLSLAETNLSEYLK